MKPAFLLMCYLAWNPAGTLHFQSVKTADYFKSYLDGHILKGDKSYGIPNILSDDNVFVEERRQIPLTKKKIAELDMDNLSESNNYRYSRNKTLIDLSCIPERIEEKILTEWKDTDQCKSKKDMLNYFMKHRLKNLMDVIEEF